MFLEAIYIYTKSTSLLGVMWRCLKPVIFLIASRGQLLCFQNNCVKVYGKMATDRFTL